MIHVSSIGMEKERAVTPDKKNEQRETDADSKVRKQPRKAYRPPLVTRLGDLAKITENGGGGCGCGDTGGGAGS